LFKFVLLNKFFIIIGVINLSGIAVLGGGLKTTPLAVISFEVRLKENEIF